jgi:VanZ family protein
LEYILGADSGGINFGEGNHLLRKATHVTEFAILAVLFTLRMRQKRRFWLFGGFAAIAAAADETIQIFSHRGSQVKDVGIDCIGVVLGTLIVYIIISRKKRKERS